MTYHLTTGDHNETAETLGEFCGETFADLDDAQSAADHLNEHLAGIGADFRAAVVARKLSEMKGHLTAIDMHDGGWPACIVVEDCEGGIWHPSDDAAAEIAATDDPCAAAVKMCRSAPGRGRWSS